VKRRLVADRYVAQVVRMHDDLRAMGLPRLPPSPVSLYMYLTSCPMLLRVPGVIAAGRAALSEALEWEIEEFDAAVEPLVELGIVDRDWRARLVFLPLVLAAEPSRPTSPSVVAMWKRELTSIPPCELRDRVIAEVAAVVKVTNPVWATAFETGCDPQRGRPKPRANHGGDQGGEPRWSPGCEPSVSDSVPIPNRTCTETDTRGGAASATHPIKGRRSSAKGRKSEPLPYGIDELQKALERSGRWTIVPLTDGQAINTQKLIRKLPLVDVELAAEWLRAGGEHWKQNLDARNFGDLPAWIAHAKKWAADGKRPINGTTKNGTHTGSIKPMAPAAVGGEVKL
jgi:hypothetical protein